MTTTRILERKHYETVSPEFALALAIIRTAKKDTLAGNIAALAWLVYVGADMADAITPGGGHTVTQFCREQLAIIGTGVTMRAWGIK